MRTFGLAFMTLLLAAAMPSAALADYAYTFHVPATVSNLPAGAVVAVECNLWAGPNRSGEFLAGQTSGAGVAAVNGSYSGTFTVKVSTTSAPGSYGCWLLISIGPTIINIVDGSPTKPQPGWTGTMLASGNLP